MMNKDLHGYVENETRCLMEAPSCCREAREAAQAWLDAAGTAGEKEALRKYLSELEEDITPVEGLIAFAGSKDGIDFFGKETTDRILQHAREIQESGAKYCDCPACAAAEAILSRKEELLES